MMFCPLVYPERTMKKSLKDIDFTVADGTLDCCDKQLTSLEGCSENVTKLICGNNQLTSFKTVC